MAQEKLKMIKLAFVAHPHGIRGEAELRLVDPNAADILDEGMTVLLYPTNERSQISPGGEEWSIQKLRFGNKIICQFEGVRDRTHLEEMIPFELYLKQDDLPEPEEGEVYLHDLVGMAVQSPQGLLLGKVESLSDNGMQYLLDVKLLSGELVTLPYVEAFFPEVDVENKKVTMITPEYME
jgi:16S rRNA processing protein RimM